eukprot:3996207-Pyramimonas_sp.AAC.1
MRAPLRRSICRPRVTTVRQTRRHSQARDNCLATSLQPSANGINRVRHNGSRCHPFPPSLLSLIHISEPTRPEPI